MRCVFLIAWVIGFYSCALSAFDVVIPCTEKDLPVLEHAIDGIRRHVKGVERIFVVSKNHLTDQAEWVPEVSYPFTLEQVGIELFQGDEAAYRAAVEEGFQRTGWYFQQLLKLYWPAAHPEGTEYYLVVDADVVFMRDVSFFYGTTPCYCPGDEYSVPYFNHMVRLLPGLRRMQRVSGIAHHMLFHRDTLAALFSQVQDRHECPFWKAFLHEVDPEDRSCSGASEYEIYFNYLLLRHTGMKIRPLRWINSGRLDHMEMHRRRQFDFVSYHDHMQHNQVDGIGF
ncbi:MAG: DUF6492 family protein [Chlamydiia bacterium]